MNELSMTARVKHVRQLMTTFGLKENVRSRLRSYLPTYECVHLQNYTRGGTIITIFRYSIPLTYRHASLVLRRCGIDVVNWYFTLLIVTTH